MASRKANSQGKIRRLQDYQFEKRTLNELDKLLDRIYQEYTELISMERNLRVELTDLEEQIFRPADGDMIDVGDSDEWTRYMTLQKTIRDTAQKISEHLCDMGFICAQIKRRNEAKQNSKA